MGGKIEEDDDENRKRNRGPTPKRQGKARPAEKCTFHHEGIEQLERLAEGDVIDSE